MRSALCRRALLSGVLVVLAARPAAATFIGDLVYCDLNRNGRFDPPTATSG